MKATIFDNYTVYADGSIFLQDMQVPTYPNKNGYLYVKLNGTMFPVHRIVASLFCTKENGKDVVMHKDGNRHNNDAANLTWGTHKENTAHAIQQGKHFNISEWNKARRMNAVNEMR